MGLVSLAVYFRDSAQALRMCLKRLLHTYYAAPYSVFANTRFIVQLGGCEQSFIEGDLGKLTLNMIVHSLHPRGLF